MTKTNFLNFYQVFNAIPKALVIKAHNQVKPLKEKYFGNHTTNIQLAENIEIDFYWLLNEKVTDHLFPTSPRK